MFGCDLATASVPADGTSGRYCRAVPHAARQAGRDNPETVRLAWLCLCRAQPAHRCGGRNRMPSASPLRATGIVSAPDPAGLPAADGRRYAGLLCSARPTSALFTADVSATLAGHR